MARRKQRRVRGALRIYARAMRGGRQWWWVQVPGRGRVSLGLACDAITREEAHRVACERHAVGALAARGARHAPEATFREVIVTFGREHASRYKPKTWATMRQRLVALQEWGEAEGLERPSQWTDEVLARWVKSRQEDSRSHATINRSLLAARVVLRWARKREPALAGWTTFERARKLREVGRQRHNIVPSPDEWKRLVTSILATPCNARFVGHQGEERHRANMEGLARLVAAAVETGMRFDELRMQRAQDVHDHAVVIAAHDDWSPKSWGERTVPVTRETADVIRTMVLWRDTAVGLNGASLVLGEHWVNDRIAEAWKRAELPGDAPTMHDARRSFATAQMRARLTIDQVRVLLGHRDVTTTERYVGRYRTDVDKPVVPVGVAGMFSSAAADVIPMRRR